jgi:hypothetical protein
MRRGLQYSAAPSILLFHFLFLYENNKRINCFNKSDVCWPGIKRGIISAIVAWEIINVVKLMFIIWTCY